MYTPCNNLNGNNDNKNRTALITFISSLIVANIFIYIYWKHLKYLYSELADGINIFSLCLIHPKHVLSG